MSGKVDDNLESTTILEDAVEAPEGAEAEGGEQNAPKRKLWPWALLAGAACAAAVWAGSAYSQPADAGKVAQAPVPTITAPAASEEEPYVVDDAAIRAIASKLEADGKRVGVEDPGKLTVSEAEGHLVIVQSVESASAEEVDLMARRGAQMAIELEGASWSATSPQGEHSSSEAEGDAEAEAPSDQIEDVTWVVTDESGKAIAAITYEPEKAVSEGTTAQVVESAKGHVLGDEAAKAVEGEQIPKSSGEGPSYEDGTPVMPGKTREEAKAEAEKPAPAEGEKAEGDAKAQEGPTEEEKAALEAASQAASNAASPATASSMSSNASSNSSSSSSSSSSASAAATPQRKWVEEKGHYEPVYEQVWVQDSAAWDEPVYSSKSYCLVTDGSRFETEQEAIAYLKSVYKETGSMLSWSVKYEQIQTGTIHHEATGHYEQQQTGQKWVVDVPGHWE